MTNSPHAHEYALRLVWDGNRGDGTADYATYGREHRVLIAGKPELLGTADVLFKGVPERHNPEDLFLAAVASCHMLAYLALCARSGICVLQYEDSARGELVLDAGGGGRFSEITLRPRVSVAQAKDERLARELHTKAHRQCFIASSCSTPIHCEPVVQAAAEPADMR